MRAKVPFLAVLGAAFAASGAHAQTAASRLEAAFERLCVAAHADQAKALSLAEAEGWTDAPLGDAYTKTLGGGLIGIPVARKMADGDKVMTLVAGHAYIPSSEGKKIGTNFCAIAEPGVPADQARSAAAQALGFAPVQSDKDSDLYAFAEEGGKRAPLTAQQSKEGLAAAEAGKLSLITAGGQPDAVLFYAVTTGLLP